jgi:hypothetical protein
MKDTPEQKFKKEHRALFNRWVEESDIEDMSLAQIAFDDINEWLDEPVIDFESDILIEEDE